MEQLSEYKTLKDYGQKSASPPGYKKKCMHLVFGIKHDSHHKAHCVASEYLTDVPVDSVYSGVVSLHRLCLLVFMAELKK